MDTKKDSAVSDVPTFKVARVGNDRKRKGAGFSFLRGGGTRGVWSGATGGAGIGGAGGAGGMAGALGMNFTKTLLALMLAGGIGSAAVYVGSRSAANGGSSGAKKPAIFSDKGDIKLEGDTSNLPSNANAIPNSLGYLSGSMDGLTPEERAKKAAEAAAAAEAQRIADEEAAKKAEADALAGKPAVDPNALLASAQGDGSGGKGSAFGKKFGSLSSSLGGGSSLSGGAGLSGGVNRQFGSSGSISKGSSGQLSAMKGGARPTTSRAGRAAVGRSNVKGFARKQLANANALSRRASTAGKSETAAYDAASAFDNNQGAGNVISGPGVGNGGRPSNGGGDSVNPGSGGGGGSIPSEPTDCGTNNYMDANGSCKPIPTESGKNVTPYQWMITVAQGLMALMTVLAAIALAANAGSAVFGIGEAIKAAIRGIMMVIGGILTALGLAIIAMTGDKMAGGIIAAIGAMTFIMGASMPESATGSALSNAVLPALLGNIAGGFASAMAKKPAAAAQ